MDSINTTVFGILTGIILFLSLLLLFLILTGGKRLRRLRSLATSDSLTGGLNLEGFCRTASRYIPDQSFQYAVVIMNIKNFRHICQTFGIRSGDQVLVHLYQVLRSVLGSTEPVARSSGSAFCFLLKNRQEEDISARLSRIIESANRFNQQLSLPYYIDLCFGIYLPQTDTESLEEMLVKAAQSLEQSPDHIPFCFYRALPGETDRHIWEEIKQLDRSLKNGDFVVYMQPKVRLSDRRIVGAEALIRWRHPQRGLLTPEMFVPLMEEYHIIHRLDLYLFEAVCQKLAEWKQAGLSPCPVSVNLSCENPDTAGFLESCSRLIRKYEVKPELIEFELNLTGQYEAPEKLHPLIDLIHTYGFQCSLDHFGAQSIPLHLLRELEADTIKLDRNLFTLENNSRRNRFVVEAILKLAAQMQIRTVAEGIDNASQVQYLQQAGCDMVQGFFYFRPMPAEDFQKTVFQNHDLRYVVDHNTDSVQSHDSADLQPASSNHIVMFSFWTGEDRIWFSDIFTPLQNGQLTISNAMSLFDHSSLIHENDRKDFFHLLERCRKEDRWVEDTLRFYTSEGRYEWLEVHLHKEYMPANGNMIISGTLFNIAEWKKEVRHWKEKANRDALTGLYNREYFEQYISNLLEKKTPAAGAIVFMDVDDFKRVNDTLGHVGGDDVLCFVAKQLLGAFRHTDIVARYAGDEFIVFVNGINRENLENRLSQLCDRFRYPYRSDTIEYPVSVSIGAAMFPEDGKLYPELLTHADSAAYTAKRNGKNQFVFYRPGMEET